MPIQNLDRRLSELETLGSAQPDLGAEHLLAKHVKAMLHWHADRMKGAPQGTGPEAWLKRREYYESYAVPCPEYPTDLASSRFDPEKLNTAERQQLKRRTEAVETYHKAVDAWVESGKAFNEFPETPTNISEAENVIAGLTRLQAMEGWLEPRWVRDTKLPKPV